jgi:PAS domain S-box-containing protein/putative nucleotidyltransferase with HDIG domain
MNFKKNLKRRMAESETAEAQRRQAEEALRESEERFRELWDHAPVAYHTLDPKGMITSINQTGAKMLGYAKEEMVGKPIFEFILPEQQAEAKKRFQQKISGQKISRAESRIYVKKDGSKIYVTINDVLERNRDGEVIGVRTTMVDITKDREAEAALRTSEEHFRDLVKKAGVAILIDDKEGNLKYFNERYAEIFGYSMEEMKKQSIWSTVHPDDAEKLRTYHMGRLQGKDVPSRYEYKCVRKDGSVKYLEVDVVVLSEGERLIGTHSYFWDITGRKQAEELLQKRNTQLELIHHIQSEIPMNTDIETVLIRAAESIGKSFGYYKISVNLYDRKTEEIEYLTAWNKTGLPLPRGHRQKLGQGLIGRAGLLKQTIIANDVSREPDFIAFHLTETKAEMVIPLLVQNQLIGVLDLQATQVGAFPKEDVSVLQAIANYIAYIVDEKQREEALRKERDKAQKYLDIAGVMIVILDPTGRVTLINKKGCEILGYPEPEIIGKNWFDHFLPKRLGAKEKESYEKLKTRSMEWPEFREGIVQTKNEEQRIILWHNTLFTDDGNSMSGILSSGEDITERKRAEEELKNSEEMFKIIFEDAPDAIYLNDLKGRFVDGNKMAEKLTGYPREELIGQTFLKLGLLSLDQIPKAASLLARNAMGKPTGPDEFVLKRKASGEVWAEIRTFPVKIREKTLVLGVARDITKRKLAEETLQKNEAKYRALFECANDAVFLLDSEGKHALVNKKAAEMLGYNIEELIGLPYKHIIAPSEYKNAQNKIKAIMEGEPSSLHERIFRKKDGTEFPVEIHLSTVRDAQGKPLYVQRIVRDITARKRAENELKQTANKLRQALGSIIKVVASTVEKRDPYTAGHQNRAADLARAIAMEMALSEDHIEGVYMAGVIHDIGKISVPAEILSKPGRLSEPEFALIKDHAKIGYEILREIEFPWPIAQIVFQHHERINGSGYPQGLAGEDILLEARILGVADVVEAMASHRPYRPAHGLKKALEEISKNRGTLYDPSVVVACLKIFAEKKFKFDHRETVTSGAYRTTSNSLG